jgi:uncharacterized membrane protein YphA (DoxX/SURF4 family)
MSQNRTSKVVLFGLTAYVAFVFIQSLFFKFTNSPETQYIFGTLNEWALSLGAPALFAPQGIFSQYVVGTFELIASVILIIGFFTRMPLVHAFGALMSMGVISGAIFFHLFTPLGVQVLNTDGTKDGGELFMLACGVWISSLILLFLHRQTVIDKLQDLRR